MGQQVSLGKPAALHKSQSARGTKRARRVGLASPNWFQLNLPHASQKNLGLLEFESRKRTANSILGPALWIGLLCVFEVSIESLEQIGREFLQVELPGEVGSLCNDKVVLVCQCLA